LSATCAREANLSEQPYNIVMLNKAIDKFLAYDSGYSSYMRESLSPVYTIQPVVMPVVKPV